MSTTKSEYRLGTSRAYSVVSSILHAGAAASVASAQLPSLLIVAAIGLLSVNLLRDLRLCAWRSAPQAVTAIRIEDGSWWLLRRDGGTVAAGAPRAVRLLWGAVVITFAVRGHGSRLVVPPDALAAQELRRLRVHGLAALGSDGR